MKIKNKALKQLLVNVLTGKKSLSKFTPDIFNLESLIRSLKKAGMGTNTDDWQKLKITHLGLFFLQYVYANIKEGKKEAIEEIFTKCDQNFLVLMLVSLPLLFNFIAKDLPKEIRQLLQQSHDVFCEIVFQHGTELAKNIDNEKLSGSLYKQAIYYCYAYALKVKDEKHAFQAIKIFQELDAINFNAATYQLLCLYDPYDTTWQLKDFRDINLFSRMADKLTPLSGEKYCLVLYNLGRMYQNGYKTENNTIYYQALAQSAQYYMSLYSTIRLNVFSELNEIFSQSLKNHLAAQKIYIHLNQLSFLNNNNCDEGVVKSNQTWLKQFQKYSAFLNKSANKTIIYKKFDYCKIEIKDYVEYFVPVSPSEVESEDITLFGHIASEKLENIIPIDKDINEKEAQIIFVSSFFYNAKIKTREPFLLTQYLELLDQLNAHERILKLVKLPEIPKKQMNPEAQTFVPSNFNAT